MALAEAGFFLLRGVLVGTVAYQCYSGLLGVRLSNSAMQTADVDFAQYHAISGEIGDAVEPLLERLHAIDPTFREIPHRTDSRFTTQLIADDGYRVDFLTPNSSSDELSDRPAIMPSFGTVAAQPLRFLDFLIREPERAVLLHGAGVPVLVPSAERFAIHKLIVATRRQDDKNGLAKSNKDRSQALALMSALVETRRTDALTDAYMEAWDRGTHWREAITASLNAYPNVAMVPILSEMRNSIRRFESKAEDYGLELPSTGGDPR